MRTRLLDCILLFATLWNIAGQAPLSMEFSRQEYRSGLPFPSPGDLPDLGIEPASPALSGGFFTTEPLGRPPAPNTHTHTHPPKERKRRERESQLLESEGTLPFSAHLIIWLFELGVESKLASFLFTVSLLSLLPLMKQLSLV